MQFMLGSSKNDRRNHRQTLLSAAEIIRSSALFDREWYCATNPDVMKAGADPLFHYAEYGWREGRDPHPLFDTRWYQLTNPDIRDTGMNPLQHYEQHGKGELRSPHRYFDARFYASQHNDDTVRADPCRHYLTHCMEPGHNPSAFFDNDWYRSRNDVGNISPLEHFVLHGDKERVSPHPYFDQAGYLKSNPDLNNILNDAQFVSPFDHFMVTGRFEICKDDSARRLSFTLGRYTFDFLNKEYLEDNADANVAVHRGHYRSGLEHFFAIGHKGIEQGLRPIYAKSRYPRLLKVVSTGSNASPRRKLCIFAHYDQDQIVQKYVLDYLRSLQQHGFDICFVTSTNDKAELEKVKPYSKSIYIKNDYGRDFWSWYFVCDHLKDDLLKSYETVLFANDSIYYPISDPSIMFDKMDKFKYDVWGISDSFDWSFGQYHIQSYFLVFEKKALEVLLPKLMDIIKSRPILSKRGQIVDFEIGFSQLALKEGLSTGAFCAIDDIREDVIRDAKLASWRDAVRLGIAGVNSTLDLWDLIIEHYHCPALKLQLLRENPRNQSNVKDWVNFVDPNYTPVEHIEAHLRRDKSFKSASSTRLIQPSVAEPDRIRVIEVLRGDQKDDGRDLVLFAHYDPDGIADEHILYSIRGFRAAGCDVATITATTIPSEIAKLRQASNVVILKSDGGRDFGSWFAAIEALRQDMSRYQDVIWVNDSSYFPLFDPNEMFDRMRSRSLDFWGVVDSHNLRWHVMSWFWAFNRRLRDDGWFEWYQGEYNSHYLKWGQIRNYEMRVPLLLRGKGYSCDSYIRAEDVSKFVIENCSDHPRFTRNINFTMTHEFWDVIIEHFRCPALKVELLRDNPLGMDLRNLYSVVAKTEYDPALIRSHIGRINMKHLGLK